MIEKRSILLTATLLVVAAVGIIFFSSPGQQLRTSFFAPALEPVPSTEPLLTDSLPTPSLTASDITELMDGNTQIAGTVTSEPSVNVNQPAAETISPSPTTTPVSPTATTGGSYLALFLPFTLVLLGSTQLLSLLSGAVR